MSSNNPWTLKKQRSREVSKKHILGSNLSEITNSMESIPQESPNANDPQDVPRTNVMMNLGRRYREVSTRSKKEEPSYTYTIGMPTTYKIPELLLSEFPNKEINTTKPNMSGIKVKGRSKEEKAESIESSPVGESEYRKWIKREQKRCIRDGICGEDSHGRYLDLHQGKK